MMDVASGERLCYKERTGFRALIRSARTAPCACPARYAIMLPNGPVHGWVIRYHDDEVGRVGRLLCSR